MILFLLAFVFVIIFLSFNLSVNQFIKTDAVTQLNTFVKQYNAEKNQSDSSQPPDLSKQPKNRTGTKAELFTVNGNYQVKNVYGDDSSTVQNADRITSDLKENHKNLENISNDLLKISSSRYYITVVKDEKQTDSYLVFYVDVTTINQFAGTINMILFLVMIVAAVVSFILTAMISKSMNRPVRELGEFARQIGRGNFQERKFSLSDTEFMELADVMNRSAKQLDSYDQEQKKFFQNVSHEFRTPLMSIKCYAEGIKYGLMNPADSGGVILAEADRLSEMVEDLLALSRMDSLSEKFEKTEHDLRETFSRCAENFTKLAEQKGIKLIYDFDKVPICFSYNEKYMARALNNLISNALRYAKSQIILTCENGENSIRVAVADDGPGISLEDLPHIFERFYKGKGGLHGIGLSIVKSVVDLHKGKISVQNEAGACFSIEFPLK